MKSNCVSAYMQPDELFHIGERTDDRKANEPLCRARIHPPVGASDACTAQCPLVEFKGGDYIGRCSAESLKGSPCAETSTWGGGTGMAVCFLTYEWRGPRRGRECCYDVRKP